ncbi:DsbA family protein [Haloplanus aerogenes]|uniref:Disulfide bond formation protein DsbA n=1 Tax=Haloplanus aerogenes TaxID=660522 RepID=A0A3M0DSF6_9EURY|nr:thioredoxin domain-containing protein [Haloplanus aerogenes]AZH25407.1 disulfide bond formation protein DsbA [Haloplanus aerogenes]RMB25115.1 thioredoxin-like protein [Haloplanus aerogenes]
MNDPTRRAVLASGTALFGAGCLGGSGGDGGGGGGSGSDDTPTLADHPVGQHLAAQPRLGPDPAEATATIVAFEDPSCPRCAAFESTTVPKIRSELVDTGQAAFVVRTVPLVYPWGDPAIHALEATYARDADAFWALFGHYFAEQDAFDADNVLDRTASFLSAETDVDAAGVVADAEAEAYADAVGIDVDAAEAADVSGTPTVFLFRDGQYRTRATGSVSFDLVTRALGL